VAGPSNGAVCVVGRERSVSLWVPGKGFNSLRRYHLPPLFLLICYAIPRLGSGSHGIYELQFERRRGPLPSQDPTYQPVSRNKLAGFFRGLGSPSRASCRCGGRSGQLPGRHHGRRALRREHSDKAVGRTIRDQTKELTLSLAQTGRLGLRPGMVLLSSSSSPSVIRGKW
jgi:hypothetical protein